MVYTIQSWSIDIPHTIYNTVIVYLYTSYNIQYSHGLKNVYLLPIVCFWLSSRCQMSWSMFYMVGVQENVS